MHWIILRPPAVYGPYDKALLTPFHPYGQKGNCLTARSPREGKFSLIHVQDLAHVDICTVLKNGSNSDSTLFEVDDGCPEEDIRGRIRISDSLIRR